MMPKKAVLFLIAGLLAAAGCDRLAGHREKVFGTVISADAAHKQVVVAEAATGRQRTLTAQRADQVSVLKPGMRVRAKLEPGTGIARKIEPRGQENKNHG